MTERIIKICGNTQSENVERAVLPFGPTHVGLICSQGFGRTVLDREGILISHAAHKRGIRVVGVFVNDSIPFIIDKADKFGLDAIQLHGNESPQSCAELSRLTSLPLIKTITITQADTLDSLVETIDGYRTDVLAFLLDRQKGSSSPIDLTIASELSTRFPILLAGGLKPTKVGSDIGLVAPMGVDVSSGVEYKLGLKEADLVQTFIEESQITFNILNQK